MTSWGARLPGKIGHFTISDVVSLHYFEAGSSKPIVRIALVIGP